MTLAALGSLIAVACNSSTSGSCIAACENSQTCAVLALIDAGYPYVKDAGNFCQDSCASDV